MACKKIRYSDKELYYFKHHQGEARSFDITITSPDSQENLFLAKLKSTLQNAENQLNRRSAPTNFILIDFSFDISAWLQKPKVKILLKSQVLALQRKSIELVVFENYEPLDLTYINLP
jgi:hypothetical protein